MWDSGDANRTKGRRQKNGTDGEEDTDKRYSS